MILPPNDKHVTTLTCGRPFILHEDLKHNHIYKGECRNGTYCIWKADEDQFYYWRLKFWPPRFFEAIDHCQSDTQYDVFMPFECLGEGTEDTLLGLTNKDEE